MVEGFSIVGFLNQLVDKHEESWIDAKYVNLIFSSILPTFKTRPSEVTELLITAWVIAIIMNYE